MKKLFLIAIIVLYPAILISQSLNNAEFSISAGYIFEDDGLYFAEANRYFYFGDTEFFKGEASLYLNSFSNNFGFGAFFTYASPYYDGYGSITMTEFGPTLKVKFKLKNNITLIPTLYIGYRSYSDDAGDGLGLNLSVITQFKFEKVNPFLDIGFVSQPAGGNDATDITIGPVMLIGGGIIF